MRYVRVTQPQSPSLPLDLKKKEGDRKRDQQMKKASVGLEGFVDWAGIVSSQPAEEEEMSKLAVGFAAQMHKRAAGSEGGSTPIVDGKRPKRSSPDEEAQKD